ncbi:MAG: helix-turn-helix domain-containing protein [Acidobacteriota bacterium]|nr:helix-turn-helix domain-containing protein [Acidobacteriota bacterium]
MGKTSRRKPVRLGEKLLHIRQALGLSQNQLIRRLGFEELVQGTISAFESGGREPSLLVLLAYARAANVSVESLIDDTLDLPNKLPIKSKPAEGSKVFR